LMKVNHHHRAQSGLAHLWHRVGRRTVVRFHS